MAEIDRMIAKVRPAAARKELERRVELIRQENREKAKAERARIPEWQSRLRTYQLTQEDIDGLIQVQEELCAICHLATPKVIDHDHSTGEVRGLLCSPCNLLLGCAKDNPATLSAAIQYLAEPPVRKIDLKGAGKVGSNTPSGRAQLKGN